MLALILAAAGAVVARAAAPGTPAYRQSVETFRAEYQKELLADDGYLTLCGLFFLEEGENSLGSAPDDVVRLGADLVPAHAGSVFVEKGSYRFVLRGGLTATLDGRALSASPMRISIPEIEQRADRFSLGRIQFWIHMSGARPAIRVRDPQCHVRRSFTSLKWFDIDPRWEFHGTLSAFPAPREIDIVNIRGDQARAQSPGTVRVSIEGTAYELLPVVDGKDLMIYFTDATAGVQTYKAVRFVKAEKQGDGTFLVDFNKAYNPPCAYSDYTTCPFPPRQNRLPVAIEAGERTYR